VSYVVRPASCVLHRQRIIADLLSIRRALFWSSTIVHFEAIQNTVCCTLVDSARGASAESTYTGVPVLLNTTGSSPRGLTVLQVFCTLRYRSAILEFEKAAVYRRRFRNSFSSWNKLAFRKPQNGKRDMCSSRHVNGPNVRQ
jgi:hypothetical protein